MKFKYLISIFFALATISYSQQVTDSYLKIKADADDPLYTTYATTMERSRLYGDKAYKMHYYSDCDPLHYSSDHAGRIYAIWMINKVVVDRIGKFARKPEVTASFPDMAILKYQPFPGIEVREIFFVYSSTIALVDMQIRNTSDKKHSISLYPILELGNDSLFIKQYDDAYILNHHESRWRLISSLYKNAPYPTELRDIFTTNQEHYSRGGYSGGIDDFYLKIKTDYYSEDKKNDRLNFKNDGRVNLVSLHIKFELEPGEKKDIQYFRGIQDQNESAADLLSEINALKDKPLQPYIDQNEKLFQSIPRIDFKTEAEKLVYLGAFNLVRGCMLPPAGKTAYNFYVFSRNPLWGWGHGHQVLHESLSMIAYAHLDAHSAQESQRVYMKQQGDDGLIAYRHGPRGPQTYPHKGMPTTSAPFFSWINWEIYQVSQDTLFLKDAYKAGSKYVSWLKKNRDSDHDGTFEWGPYGIIENVRDWYNAVFQVSAERYLDVDKEDISDELECLDLSLMVVKEMKSLAKMASELGKNDEAKQWIGQADEITTLINERMWDKESEFYYHVNKADHSFQFMTRDLRRQEIIGLLPLWAEAAPKDRADKLIRHLTNPDKFWRKYGVPTLAADDPWYSSYVDYCCKWNGPVWLLWDYMVFQGLLNYGYHDLAAELADKMILAVSTQLSLNHNYWESFSPDNTVLDCPPNYIWDSIMAKVLIDLYRIK